MKRGSEWEASEIAELENGKRRLVADLEEVKARLLDPAKRHAAIEGARQAVVARGPESLPELRVIAGHLVAAVDKVVALISPVDFVFSAVSKLRGGLGVDENGLHGRMKVLRNLAQADRFPSREFEGIRPGADSASGTADPVFDREPLDTNFVRVARVVFAGARGHRDRVRLGRRASRGVSAHGRPTQSRRATVSSSSSFSMRETAAAIDAPE